MREAVARDGVAGVLATGGREPAAGWQERGDRELVGPDQGQCCEAGDREYGAHRHLGAGRKAIAPTQQLTPEGGERGAVGYRPCTDDEVAGPLYRLDLRAPQLPESAPQPIASHCRRSILRDNESHAWVVQGVWVPDHLERLRTIAAALLQCSPDVANPRQPAGSREPPRRRQEPPCFDGIETVSRFLPFLRRRDKMARPQRVAMRARNPCLLTRRRLRGR